MTEIILFAVEKKDVRWRFRIDDISHFEYVFKQNPYVNHKFLVNILIAIQKVIKKQTICDFIKHLIENAEDLKNAKNPSYMKILISKVEKETLTI